MLRTRILGLFFRGYGFKIKHLNKHRSAKRALVQPTNKAFLPLPPVPYAYAEVFRKLGYPLDLSKHEFPGVQIRKDSIALEELQTDKKWIGVAPFAAHLGKRYPLDLMQKVMAYLAQNLQLLLFGAGPQELSQM